MKILEIKNCRECSNLVEGKCLITGSAYFGAGLLKDCPLPDKIETPNEYEETLEAKLRNHLSPIYGLADMVLKIDQNPKMLEIVKETAKQVFENKKNIRLLLDEIEKKPSFGYLIKPFVAERFADNGEHSHWELINEYSGEVIWSEFPEETIARGQKIVDYNNVFKVSPAFGWNTVKSFNELIVNAKFAFNHKGHNGHRPHIVLRTPNENGIDLIELDNDGKGIIINSESTFNVAWANDITDISADIVGFIKSSMTKYGAGCFVKESKNRESILTVQDVTTFKTAREYAEAFLGAYPKELPRHSDFAIEYDKQVGRLTYMFCEYAKTPVHDALQNFPNLPKTHETILTLTIKPSFFRRIFIWLKLAKALSKIKITMNNNNRLSYQTPTKKIMLDKIEIK